MIKPDLTMPLPAELGRLHFTGIGGSGMSGIARLFLDAGYAVTGSDLRDTDAVRDPGGHGLSAAALRHVQQWLTAALGAGAAQS